jgi:hypothetical protein
MLGNPKPGAVTARATGIELKIRILRAKTTATQREPEQLTGSQALADLDYVWLYLVDGAIAAQLANGYRQRPRHSHVPSGAQPATCL